MSQITPLKTIAPTSAGLLSQITTPLRDPSKQLRQLSRHRTSHAHWSVTPGVRRPSSPVFRWSMSGRQRADYGQHNEKSNDIGDRHDASRAGARGRPTLLPHTGSTALPRPTNRTISSSRQSRPRNREEAPIRSRLAQGPRQSAVCCRRRQKRKPRPSAVCHDAAGSFSTGIIDAAVTSARRKAVPLNVSGMHLPTRLLQTESSRTATAQTASPRTGTAPISAGNFKFVIDVGNAARR